MSLGYAHETAERAFLRAVIDEIDPGRGTTDITKFVPYAHDPVGFVTEVIGAEPARTRDADTLETLAESYQADFLESCARTDRVAWRAAHGVGKTTGDAWLIMWWLLTRPFSRAIVLAPAFQRQIGEFLWPEIRQWTRTSRTPLPLDIQTTRIGVIPYPAEWYALAVQSTDPTKVEGGHAKHLMVLGDEAKGLPSATINALQGTQTDVEGERLFVLTSVPGAAEGAFYDVFTELSEDWELHHTPAIASSRVRLQWVEDRKKDFREGSFDYVTRVEANFYKLVEGGLFDLELLEEMKATLLRVGTKVELDENGIPIVKPDATGKLPKDLIGGLDVAAGGREESVLTLRTDSNVWGQWVWTGDSRGPIANFLRPYKERLDYINEDKTGLGEYHYRHLQDLGFPVRPWNFGAEPVDPERFKNAASEGYFDLHERASEGRLRGLGSELKRLYAQLSSVKITYDSRGRAVLVDKRESAKEAKKKMAGPGWTSPDRGDSLMLAYASPQETEPELHVF